MLQDAAVQDDIMPAVCKLLQDTVAFNDEELRLDRTTINTTAQPLATTPADYVDSILAKDACSPCGIVVGLLYLERLKTKMSRMRLTSNNFQGLLCVSFNLGSKFCDDEGLNNKQWAAQFGGGMRLKELNVLELELLLALNFNLGVTPVEYKRFLRLLLEEAGELSKASLTHGGPTAAAVDGSVPKGCKWRSALDDSGISVLVQFSKQEDEQLTIKRRKARRAWGAHVRD